MPNNRTFILLASLTCLLLTAGGIGLWLAAPESSTPTPKVVPRIARLLLELKDGRLCPKAGGGPFTGIMYEKTTAGRLLSEIPLNEGIVHGIARGWHENGQLEVEEPFENGHSHGLRTRYHPNGKKRSQATIVKGSLEGPFTEWHENGQLAVRMNMADGKGEGLCEAWHLNGKPKSKVNLKNGEPIQTEYFTGTAQ
jgi:antitoxin component YwqK of YwqJK toxin-antitoxin module